MKNISEVPSIINSLMVEAHKIKYYPKEYHNGMEVPFHMSSNCKPTYTIGKPVNNDIEAIRYIKELLIILISSKYRNSIGEDEDYDIYTAIELSIRDVNSLIDLANNAREQLISIDKDEAEFVQHSIELMYGRAK